MFLTGRIIQIDVRQSFSDPADTKYFASEFCPAVNHRFDHGVQSGTSPPPVSTPMRFFGMYDSLLGLSLPPLSDSAL